MSPSVTFGAQRANTMRLAWPQDAVSLPGAAVEPEAHTLLGIASEARVLSDRGLLPATELRPGDRLSDGRGGWTALAAAPTIRADIGPERVFVPAGALGGGLPRADLVVGPRTRLRLTSRLAGRLVGSDEALIAAEDLTGLMEGVRLDTGILCDVSHLVFEQHAVFVAEDVIVEALVPDTRLVASLPETAASEILGALPKLRYAGASASYEPPVPVLDRREVRQILSAPSTFGASPCSLPGDARSPTGAAPCRHTPGISGRSARSPACGPWRSLPTTR